MWFIRHCVTWLCCPSDLPPFHLPHYSSSCQLPTHPLCSRQTEFPQLRAMISQSPDPMLSGHSPALFILQCLAYKSLPWDVWAKLALRGHPQPSLFHYLPKRTLKLPAMEFLPCLLPSTPKGRQKFVHLYNKILGCLGDENKIWG